jgi:serine/threonine protein phosphatase 1
MRWIIGDIHGMLRPLQALLGAISRRDPAAHFIFVGDYVNRGLDSRKVIDLLLTLPRATFLRGNHDDIFDLLLHGDCYICHPSARNPLGAFTWFMQHGLAETLMSYGAPWQELENALHEPGPERIAQFVKPVPQSHRRFIRSLKPLYESDDFFVAHGFWGPGEPDDAPNLATQIDGDPTLRYRLLWGRFTDAQIHGPKHWHRTGYFGHTPVLNYPAGADLTPVVGPQVVLLDTASALTPAGMLSAVCVETGTVLQADRAGETIELPEH